MDDLEYIKRFSKISIKNVCEKTKANRSNVLSGNASKKTINKVKKQIESEVAKLYIIEDNDEKRES
jgi:hypothetical protein